MQHRKQLSCFSLRLSTIKQLHKPATRSSWNHHQWQPGEDRHSLIQREFRELNYNFAAEHTKHRRSWSWSHLQVSLKYFCKCSLGSDLNFIPWQHCAYDLLRFRHKNHLVRVRERSMFCPKIHDKHDWRSKRTVFTKSFSSLSDPFKAPHNTSVHPFTHTIRRRLNQGFKC